MKRSGRCNGQANQHAHYVTLKRHSCYGHAMRRDDKNVTKEVTTMKMGRERPREWPKLRWMDRVRSDLKEHQLNQKLAQNREAWINAIQSWRSTPERDIIGKGEQSK